MDEKITISMTGQEFAEFVGREVLTDKTIDEIVHISPIQLLVLMEVTKVMWQKLAEKSRMQQVVKAMGCDTNKEN